MAKFTTSKAQDCGITLGGIGTGSVELFPDGEFHQWQIANPDSWAFSLNGKPNASDGEEHTGALSFWVRTRARCPSGSAPRPRVKPPSSASWV